MAMTSEINAAIKQNDFQRVRILVETIIEQVSSYYCLFLVTLTKCVEYIILLY